MTEQFVLYELAVKLKALGFDEDCLRGWDKYNKIWYHPDSDVIIDNPTFSQAFRWFREKYQLHSTITSISQESWQWHITKPGESLGKLYDEDFYTYEEAELACLNKLIEIVETKSE